MFFSFIIFVLLTCVNAIFVLAEFSLTSVEKSTIEQEIKKKNSFYIRNVKLAQQSLSIQLSSVQLGITVATLITGIIALPVFKLPLTSILESSTILNSVNNTSFVALLALIFATSFSMIFGELIPKNIAIAHPLKTAKYTAFILVYFTKIFKQIVFSLDKFSNMVLKLFDIEPVMSVSSARSTEELESIVKNAAQNGTINAKSAKTIDKSLSFGDLVAEELMTPRTKIKYLKISSTIKDLIDLSMETGLSRFPVTNKDLDDFIGVVHIKQSFAFDKNKIETTKLETILNPILTVPATLDGDSIMSRLKSGSMQIALVIDEYGSSAGIITMEDLVEEIVGNVQDEHDNEIEEIIKLKDGWIVSGLIRLDEFFDNTRILLEKGDYDTLAGFLLTQFNKIPNIGETIMIKGHITDLNNYSNEELNIRAKILGLERHRIDLIELKILNKKEINDI